MKKQRVYKWGHSAGLLLPKKLLQASGIGNPIGKKLALRAINGAIIITRPSDKETDIDRLFKGYDYKKYNCEVRRQNGGTLEQR